MIFQIIIGCALIVITSVIHASGMSLGLRSIMVINDLKQLSKASILARSLTVAALILILFITTLIEAGIWALFYMNLGALPDYVTAFYFSTVTYTTLGYGDVVLDSGWRLLSSFQAANGVIIFGWTTAVVIVAIHQVSRSLNLFESSV